MTTPRNALTAGTLRGLRTLADRRGRFKMIATDQRPPIFAALARHGDRRPEEVRHEEAADVKRALVSVLAPEATAVLVDPVWGHPAALGQIPGDVGLISTLEGYDFDEAAGGRVSRPIEDWSVAKIKRAGADGVKVLAWYRPDAGEEVREHQERFVAEVGEACARADVPFVLELVIYPFPGEDPRDPAYLRAQPERVLGSVRAFADEHFGVDLLKLQFPADLKSTREFAGGAFDGIAREPIFTLDDVQEQLRAMHDATHVPWVLLSAGVGPREFAVDVELACAAGACGFLAGRAVWQGALDAYPDMAAVASQLQARSLPFLRQISAIADAAPAWTDHPRYGGQVELAGAGPAWSREYPA